MATYVFLGNTDPQDTYLLFDGHELVITRSIRRIATAWRGHLAFYINFSAGHGVQNRVWW